MRAVPYEGMITHRLAFVEYMSRICTACAGGNGPPAFQIMRSESAEERADFVYLPWSDTDLAGSGYLVKAAPSEGAVQPTGGFRRTDG